MNGYSRNSRPSHRVSRDRVGDRTADRAACPSRSPTTYLRLPFELVSLSVFTGSPLIPVRTVLLVGLVYTPFTSSLLKANDVRMLTGGR